MTGPLDGIRILDLTSSVMGPYAAMQLGDMGADIIKVEPPSGDSSRAIGTGRSAGMASFFLGFNRNKRALVLDLKQDAGIDALRRLAGSADAMIVNLRPAAAKRLGIDAAAMRAINPSLIHVAAYGYRADGPYANNAAYDDIIQAGCGFAYLQGSQGGDPHYVPSIIADKTSGLMVAQAVLAALVARGRTGEGQAVEVPMFESMVSFLTSEHLEGQTFVPALGTMGYKRIMTAERRPFPTSDGFIAILPYNDRNWGEFCAISGRVELLEDPRFATQAARFGAIDDFYRLVASIVASKTTAEWLTLLAPTNIPYGPLNSLDALLDDPQLAATGFWQVRDHPTEGKLRYSDFPLRFDGTPTGYRRHQPRLGEHSLEILREAGLSDDELADMLATGATSQP